MDARQQKQQTNNYECPTLDDVAEALAKLSDLEKAGDEHTYYHIDHFQIVPDGAGYRLFVTYHKEPYAMYNKVLGK